MPRRLIFRFTVLSLLILGASGCSNPKSPASATLPPTAPAVPTPTPSPTSTPTITPTKALTAADLVPMYEIGNTSALQEDDIYPGVDIMTNAEQQLRDAGFGDELDNVTEDLMTYAGRNIREHTFIPKYALNTLLEKPVYSIFLYDQTCDCFLLPSYDAEIGEDSLSLTKLTVPAGLSYGGEIRFIPTKTGILPGAFYNTNMFLGWYEIEKGQWHLSQSAKSYLETMYAMQNTQVSLEANLTDWLSGETVIPSSDLFEKSVGKPLKLNYVSQEFPFGSIGIENYYGILLGLSIKDDALFAFIGFEDVSSKRYYIPFNLGKVSDVNCVTTFGTISSNLGNFYHRLDQYTNYQCDTLRLVLASFINKPIKIQQIMGNLEDFPPGFITNTDGFKSQEDYALSLAKFIYRSSTSPIGSNTFEGRINPPPDSVTSDVYPKSFIDLYVRK